MAEDSARHALADVVVGLTFEVERHAAGHEGAEALPGGAGKAEINRAFGQALLTITASDLTGEHAADGSVHVAHGNVEPNAFALFERRFRSLDQHHVQRGAEAVVLLDGLADAHARTRVGFHQHVRKVELATLSNARRWRVDALGRLARPSPRSCESRGWP